MKIREIENSKNWKREFSEIDSGFGKLGGNFIFNIAIEIFSIFINLSHQPS